MSRDLRLRELELLRERARRLDAEPILREILWHQEAPRTSQRSALSPLSESGVTLSLILGGNRSGKTRVSAAWAVAQALGREYQSDWGAYPVRVWLANNALPTSIVGEKPSRVWVASPTFSSAIEQIRPHIRSIAPKSSRFSGWDSGSHEGICSLPNGGSVRSKAYRQYLQDPQTWEGASISGVVFDEQPPSMRLIEAAFWRMVDQGGRAVVALTHLRGKRDWFYRELIAATPSWARVRYLDGADNPHISQEAREQMLAQTPEGLRAARARGEPGEIEGSCYPLHESVHLIDPIEPSRSWPRRLGIDWGGRAPHVVWLAQRPDGVWIAYRELAPRRDLREGAVSDRRLLQWMIDAEKGTNDQNLHIDRVADSENPGGITEAADLGVWIRPAKKGAGSVAVTMRQVEALFWIEDPLTHEPCMPRLLITRDCPVLWGELRDLAWKKDTDPSDPVVDPSCPDHGPDALRYALFG